MINFLYILVKLDIIKMCIDLDDYWFSENENFNVIHTVYLVWVYTYLSVSLLQENVAICNLQAGLSLPRLSPKAIPMSFKFAPTFLLHFCHLWSTPFPFPCRILSQTFLAHFCDVSILSTLHAYSKPHSYRNT